MKCYSLILLTNTLTNPKFDFLILKFRKTIFVRQVISPFLEIKFTKLCACSTDVSCPNEPSYYMNTTNDDYSVQKFFFIGLVCTNQVTVVRLVDCKREVFSRLHFFFYTGVCPSLHIGHMYNFKWA